MLFRKASLAAGVAVLAVSLLASTASAARRDRTPPTTPTNLRVVESTATSVRLAWNASTDNSGSFKYYVRESGLNDRTVTVPQTQTTLTFSRLWPDRTYTYTVWAVDAAGNRSGNSNTVSYTTPPDVTPPTPAPQLTVNPFRPARAGFSWTQSTDNVSQVQYTLYANGIPQVAFFYYTQHTLFYLTPSATYEFQVIARDVFGNAVAGDPVTVTMPSSADTEPPTPPTNLTGAEMANEVHMSWGLSTDDTDPQSEILYEFYLNGVLNPDVNFGSSGFVYCREASGFTTVVARAVDSSGNRSGPSNEIIVQCP
jgi:chitodextrinase